MGTLATIKFGLGIAAVILGALFAAFLCYMSTFGKKSSLYEKNKTEPEKSI
jgi:hypothetical protein